MEPEEPENEPENTDTRKVKIYDFRRPNLFTRDKKACLEMIHGTFARLLTTGFSTRFKRLIGVELVSVDELVYEEFIRSVPNPDLMAVVQMEPLSGFAILDIDPPIAFNIIDSLFGGRGRPINLMREVTEIELSFLRGIILEMLSYLGQSWYEVQPLKPSLNSICTNPQFMQILAPDARIVLVVLGLKSNELKGVINLCLPWSMLAPIAYKLSSRALFAGREKEPGKTITENIRIQTHPEFDGGYGRLQAKRLGELKTGDLLPVGKDYNSNLFFSVDPLQREDGES